MSYYFKQFHSVDALSDARDALLVCLQSEAKYCSWSSAKYMDMLCEVHRIYNKRLDILNRTRAVLASKVQGYDLDDPLPNPNHVLDAFPYKVESVEYACLITDKMYGEPIYTQGESYMQLNMFNHKVIGVKFVDGYGADRSSKLYHYFTDDLTIKNDDFCIVIGGSGAPAVVKVYDDNVTVDIDKATRPIVCKIDTTAYFEKQKQLALRQAALKRLEELDREDKAMNKYADLASRNKEAAQLLQQLGMMEGIGGLIEPEPVPVSNDVADNNGIDGAD